MNQTNCLQQRSILPLFRDYNSQNVKQTKFTEWVSGILDKEYNLNPYILDDTVTIPYIRKEIDKLENQTISDLSKTTVIVVSTRGRQICAPLVEDYCKDYSSKTELIIVGLEGDGKWNRWRQLLDSRRICGKYVSVKRYITKDALLDKICRCATENQNCYDNKCDIGSAAMNTQESPLSTPVFVSSLMVAFLFGVVLTIAFRYLRGCWTNNKRNRNAYSKTKPGFVNETYFEDNVICGAPPDEFYETIKEIPILPPRPTMKSETKNMEINNDPEQSLTPAIMKTGDEMRSTNRSISIELRDRKIHADIESDQRCTSECPCIKTSTDDSLEDHAYFVLQAEV